MRCEAALVPGMGEEIVVEEADPVEPSDNEVRIKKIKFCQIRKTKHLMFLVICLVSIIKY